MSIDIVIVIYVDNILVGSKDMESHESLSKLNLTEDELKNFGEQETEQDSSQILRLFIICTKKENRRCNHLFSETEIKTMKFHTPMY